MHGRSGSSTSGNLGEHSLEKCVGIPAQLFPRSGVGGPGSSGFSETTKGQLWLHDEQ
jgi:hypothetical protein